MLVGLFELRQKNSKLATIYEIPQWIRHILRYFAVDYNIMLTAYLTNSAEQYSSMTPRQNSVKPDRISNTLAKTFTPFSSNSLGDAHSTNTTRLKRYKVFSTIVITLDTYYIIVDKGSIFSRTYFV